MQRVDEYAERLPRALAARASHARADLNGTAPRLRPELLRDRIDRASERLSALWRLAELAHPDRPLRRGFARVTSRAGKTIVRAGDAEAERLLTLHFGDGKVAVSAGAADTGVMPVAAQVERKARRSYVPPQPGLFDED